MSSLKKAILATIAYYDALEMPVTSFEVWKYLVRRPADFADEASLAQIMRILNDMCRERFLECKNGMYMLRGRPHFYEKRIRRQKIADKKWKRVRRIVWWFQAVPFVRAVFASGSLAFNHMHESSDLDVLVVCAHGRIWTGRAFVTALTEFFGVRRRRFGVIARDKICLNHYISTHGLSIPYRSLYNAETYVRLVPLLEQGISLRHFWKGNEEWLTRYLFRPPSLPVSGFRMTSRSRILGGIRRGVEWLLAGVVGDWFERMCAWLQRKRILQDPWTYREGGRISIDDTHLEFHPDSPERSVINRYNQAVRKAGIPELAGERDSGLR